MRYLAVGLVCVIAAFVARGAEADPTYEGYVWDCFEGKVTKRIDGRFEFFDVQLVNKCGASYVVQLCRRPKDRSEGWTPEGGRKFLMNNQPLFHTEVFGRDFEYAAVGCKMNIPGGCSTNASAHDPHCPR